MFKTGLLRTPEFRRLMGLSMVELGRSTLALSKEWSFGVNVMHIRAEDYRRVLENLYEGVYVIDRERRIVFWNKGAEQITGFKSNEVLGAQCRDNVLRHTDMEGKGLCATHLCPAVKTIEDGLEREEEVYLHHKEGHRLPVLTKFLPLREASGSISGAVEVFTDCRDLREIRRRVEDLERLAYLDGTTGTANRRYGEIQLDRALSDMRLLGSSFGVFFIDLDKFKAVNDTYGHQAGDSVLKMVAQTLTNALRPGDVVCRWGGEEFLAIAQRLRDVGLTSVGERMRSLVEQSFIDTNDGQLSCTVSVGATMARKEDTVDTVIRRADRLMYESKQGGRNRVTSDWGVMKTGDVLGRLPSP
jgi:diguanylate cyclase (GGDEF)-like protein/PAS domain S-box-containing protein